MVTRSACVAVVMGLVAVGTAHAQPFSGLAGNTWRQAKPASRVVYQSAVHPVDETQPDKCLTTVNRAEPVTRTYSGLVAGGGKVFNWGGGHGSHPGNDVDLYDPVTNAWSVELAPECPANGSRLARGIAGAGGAVPVASPLGRPYTQHTYRQCAWDGSRFLCVVPSGTWAYDMGARSWARLAGPDATPQWYTGSGGVVWTGTNLLAIVADHMGRLAQHRGVYAFTPDTKRWAFRGGFPEVFAGVTPIAAYNPDQGEVIVHLARFGIWRYTLATGAWARIPNQPAALQAEPNFDYDTLARRAVFLIAPVAGTRPTAVWTLDPATNAWARLPAPAMAPSAYPNASGSERGHFVYVKEANVFVYVESVSLYCGLGGGWSCGGATQTWIYRHVAAPSAASPPAAPDASGSR